jgi:hypothetical protein
LLDGVEQWFGPAAIDLGVWLWLPQQAVEIEKPVLVLRPHGDPAAVGGELVEEGAWQKTGRSPSTANPSSCR